MTSSPPAAIPPPVRHGDFVPAGGHAFHLRRDMGEVIEGLDAWREALSVADRRRRREGHQALLVAVSGPQRDRVHDTDDRGLGAFTRIESQIPDAAGYEEPDVGILEPALAHGLFHETRHGIFGQRYVDPHPFRRGIQPIEVLGEAEDAPVVDTNPLEHAVTVQQAVVEHRNPGVRLVAVLAVDPDEGGHRWRGGIYRSGARVGYVCARSHEASAPPSLRKGDDLLEDAAGEVLVPGNRALLRDDLNAGGALGCGGERDRDFPVRCGALDLPLVLAPFLLRCCFRLPDPELAERLLGRGRGALDRGCNDRLNASLREVNAAARAGSGGGQEAPRAAQHCNGNERCLHDISNALALLARLALNSHPFNAGST